MADKHAQLKYLKDRLDSLMRRKNVFGWSGRNKVKLKKPAEVIAAERQIKQASAVISRFEKKQEAATERRDEQRKGDYEACRKEVFFGDPHKALKMLDQFEAKW
jgi:hypothetical protein